MYAVLMFYESSKVVVKVTYNLFCLHEIRHPHYAWLLLSWSLLSGHLETSQPLFVKLVEAEMSKRGRV